MRLIYSTFLLLFSCFASASTFGDDASEMGKVQAQIQTIKQHLQKNQIKYSDLAKTKEMVMTIENDAKACIKKNTKTFSELSALAADSKISVSNISSKNTDDYLALEKEKISKKLSDCNLLRYEAEKLHKKLDEAINYNKAVYHFPKTDALWQIKDTHTLFKIPDYDLKQLSTRIGLNKLNTREIRTELSIHILFYLGLGYLLYRICFQLFKSNAFTKQLLPPLRHYLPLIFTLIMTILYMKTLFKNIYPPPILEDIIKHFNYFFCFLLFAALNRVIFSYRKQTKTKHDIQKVINGSICLGFALITNTLLRLIKPTEAITTTNLNAYSLFYLAAISILFMWVFDSGLKLILKYKYCSSLQYQLMTIANTLLFTGLVISACFGYNAFALFFTDHLIKSLLLIFVFAELLYVIWSYAHVLHNKNAPLAIHLHQFTGLKPQKNLIEVSILKFLLSIILIHYFFKLSVILWDLPGYYLTTVLDFFENGLYLFNLQINLLAILRGLTVFCLIIISGRFLGAFFATRNKAFEQKNTRINIITLTNYVAFIIAFLISLMVIGINLSGFALVASALSVGIGFGLKGIAADLISGLILLLSKRLRPGDYIEIKGVEGFIDQVMLLSTEIKTLSQSSIILPNSSLISQSVTNYTYKNKLTRSTTYIMLKDAVDVKRTKKIMLDVAKRHPDVHQDEKNKPVVIVELRPDKSAMHIVLTLWCIIKNADDKYRINSDINAKVLAAVEKADIPLKL